MFLKRFAAVVRARNKEYWADTASLFFSFVVPPFLILVMSIAFQEDSNIFNLATIDGVQVEAPSYIKQAAFVDRQQAIAKIKYHQYDLLVASDSYWINPESIKGEALEDILSTELQPLKRQPIVGDAVRYVDWVIPGILGMNLMFSAFFGIGFVIVRYRKNGVLKRLKATPLKPLEFISAQIVSRLIILLIISITIFTVANLMLDLLVIGSYIDMLIVVILGCTAMLSMALIFAARIKSEELANTSLNAITLPMLLLSEAWFSLDSAPEWVQNLSQIFPLTHMVGAARSIMLDGASLADVSSSILFLAAIIVVSLALVSRIFKWN